MTAVESHGLQKSRNIERSDEIRVLFIFSRLSVAYCPAFRLEDGPSVSPAVDKPMLRGSGTSLYDMVHNDRPKRWWWFASIGYQIFLIAFAIILYTSDVGCNARLFVYA